MDANNIPDAERHADPSAIACYTFGEGELAQFGRYLNRGYGGAAYDLTTRVGTPLVGHGGGVYVNNVAGSYWGSGVNPTTSVAMAMVWAEDALPGGNRYPVLNGGGSQHYFKVAAVVPYVGATLSAGGAMSDAGFNPAGRGPVLYLARHYGGAQELWANGRLRDSDVVAFSAPTAGNLIGGGQHGTTSVVWFYSTMPTDPRASYVRDFARRVIYSWAPHDVGEGPAGGIATGAVGEGDWYCPSGGASLAFVWRRDASEPSGGHLALTDSGAVSMRRLDFCHTKMPCFGSWLIEYEVRDPATDSMIVGFTPQRGVDPTLAGSGSYWTHTRTAAGPWWRSSVYLANGAQIDAVDAAFPGPVANDKCKLLVTRTVAGDWQTYQWVQSLGSWYWSTVTGNDVAVLSSNYLTIAPRGAYVSRVTRFQGEMLPDELP